MLDAVLIYFTISALFAYVVVFYNNLTPPFGGDLEQITILILFWPAVVAAGVVHAYKAARARP
jgi:hypothetical protein